MSEILDIPYAIEQAGGNPELAKELFTMLLNDLPVLRDKLNQAFADSDSQALWDHTHKIHGSTAYCGVPALREAARRLEGAIKQQAEDLTTEIETLNQAILELLESGAAALERDW